MIEQEGSLGRLGMPHLMRFLKSCSTLWRRAFEKHRTILWKIWEVKKFYEFSNIKSDFSSFTCIFILKNIGIFLKIYIFTIFLIKSNWILELSRNPELPLSLLICRARQLEPLLKSLRQVNRTVSKSYSLKF